MHEQGYATGRAKLQLGLLQAGRASHLCKCTQAKSTCACAHIKQATYQPHETGQAIYADSSPYDASGTGDKYQEAGLHSHEQGTLHVHSCHYRLVDHVQAVTHGTRLLQPVAPAQSALL